MFDNLPVEIVLHILRYLDTESLYRLAEASQRVKEICQNISVLRIKLDIITRAKEHVNRKLANRLAKFRRAREQKMKNRRNMASRIQASFVPLKCNVMKKYLKNFYK